MPLIFAACVRKSLDFDAFPSPRSIVLSESISRSLHQSLGSVVYETEVVVKSLDISLGEEKTSRSQGRGDLQWIAGSQVGAGEVRGKGREECAGMGELTVLADVRRYRELRD